MTVSLEHYARCKIAARSDTGEQHAIRCASGLIVYEEGLRDGAWITRYWSPVGRIEPDPVIPGRPGDNAVFRIELGGTAASNAWSLISATILPA